MFDVHLILTYLVNSILLGTDSKTAAHNPKRERKAAKPVASQTDPIKLGLRQFSMQMPGQFSVQTNTRATKVDIDDL